MQNSVNCTKVSPRTVNLECMVLRMILTWAKLWARVADDYKPLPQSTEGPGRALSPEEEERLFEVAGSNPNWVAAYYAAQIAANTTARSCELSGLRLADLDWEAHSIIVRRVVTKTDAGWFSRKLESSRVLGLELLFQSGDALPSLVRFRAVDRLEGSGGVLEELLLPLSAGRTAGDGGYRRD